MGTLRLTLQFFFQSGQHLQVPTIQTSVGSYANFSFMLTEDPNTSLVNIKDRFGVIVMTAFDTVGVSKDPLYKDRVNFTGNTYQKLISFILRNVTLADAGIYTAVLIVPNRTIGSQMLIVKASPSKPQIVELEGPAVDGTNYRLNCSAQSNSQPPNHNLSMFSEWRRDDMLINSSGRYIVSGTELTITGLSYKQDNGSALTCVAFEDQLLKSVNSDKFIMDVKCKYTFNLICKNPHDYVR
ncbi:hypothetical protein ACJMK2_006991 [Sinanodonta woodiana]|uniref:Ig-like domain-containing protein n=1 Tax=Sinanodonta woodiana TaxID=1069815 RepID=A0ABD3VHE7_SINWO